MLLYLHGFCSSPASRKAQTLGARLAERGRAGEFVCPALSHVPERAVAQAEALISASASPVTLVGSSLGGFYATWLAQRHGLRAVLVNPAVLAPISLADFVGPQTNLYSGETFDFTPAHVDQLRKLELPAVDHPERLWLLVETGDEVLDYREAVRWYAGARQTVLAGGDHSFTRWTAYLDEIIAFAGLA